MGSSSKKYVYFFGGGKADGNESMKNLLGGKGDEDTEYDGERVPIMARFEYTG